MKIFLNSTFHNFTTFSILSQGTMLVLLQRKNSFQVEGTWLRPRLEIWICVLAEKWAWKSNMFSFNKAFLQFLNVDITERYNAADKLA